MLVNFEKFGLVHVILVVVTIAGLNLELNMLLYNPQVESRPVLKYTFFLWTELLTNLN